MSSTLGLRFGAGGIVGEGARLPQWSRSPGHLSPLGGGRGPALLPGPPSAGPRLGLGPRPAGARGPPSWVCKAGAPTYRRGAAPTPEGPVPVGPVDLPASPPRRPLPQTPARRGPATGPAAATSASRGCQGKQSFRKAGVGGGRPRKLRRACQLPAVGFRFRGAGEGGPRAGVGGGRSCSEPGLFLVGSGAGSPGVFSSARACLLLPPAQLLPGAPPHTPSPLPGFLLGRAWCPPGPQDVWPGPWIPARGLFGPCLVGPCQFGRAAESPEPRFPKVGGPLATRLRGSPWAGISCCLPRLPWQRPEGSWWGFPGFLLGGLVRGGRQEGPGGPSGGGSPCGWGLLAGGMPPAPQREPRASYLAMPKLAYSPHGELTTSRSGLCLYRGNSL